MQAPISMGGARARPRLARVLGALVGVVAWGLLAWNTAAWRPGELDRLQQHVRRYWEDLAVATSNYVARDGEVARAGLASSVGSDLYNAYKRYMPKAAAAEGLRPWQFWRTIPVKPFLRRARLEQRPYDDPGRAGLMRVGFHLLGGVAPYLGLWLGVLLAGPVLIWLGFELCAAGRTVAGVTLPLLLGGSAFFVEVLALAYSAVGFYVIAVVLLAVFAAYALLAPEPTRRGLLGRALAAGLVFALCALCRSSVLLLLPGWLLAAAWGAWRVTRGAGGGLRPRLLLALVVCGALFGPYALVRPARHHGVWGDLWQGLGDFDRTRGHYWSDVELRKLLRRQGLPITRNAGVDFESDQTEATLRRIFLDDVRAAPLWYLDILVRRTLATVTQWKLRPYGPADGVSIAPQTSENEGLTDSYYAMVAPADVFGVGRWRREWRLELLWLPPLGLLVAGAVAWRRGRLETAERLGRASGLVVCLGLAALPVPVIFSTSTAFETQTFALAYFAGLALALDELALWALRSRAPRPSGA